LLETTGAATGAAGAVAPPHAASIKATTVKVMSRNGFIGNSPVKQVACTVLERYRESTRMNANAIIIRADSRSVIDPNARQIDLLRDLF
jgi:hypothetical protein